jgi:type IV secretion system protein VirD4
MNDLSVTVCGSDPAAMDCAVRAIQETGIACTLRVKRSANLAGCVALDMNGTDGWGMIEIRNAVQAAGIIVRTPPREAAAAVGVLVLFVGGGFAGCSAIGAEHGGFGVGLVIWAVTFFGVGTLVSAMNSPGQVVQPPKPTPYGDAHWATEGELDKHGYLAGDVIQETELLVGWTAANKPIRYAGDGQIVTIGATGTGKLSSIIYGLHSFGGSAIVNDPKGQISAIAGRRRAQLGPVYYINPFNVLGLGTSSCNPIAELDPESPTFPTDSHGIAQAAVIPGGAHSDPYWWEAPRNLFGGVIGWARSAPGEVPTLGRVSDLLHADEHEFKALLRRMAQSPHKFIRHAARPFLDSKEARSLPEVMTALRTQLSFLVKPIERVLSKSDFRWSDAKKGTITVFIILPQQRAADFHRFTRLLYASSLRALLTFPRAPVYYVLDELATSIGDKQMELLENAANTARDFGVKLHMVFQNWSQLKSIFGDKAGSIESSAGLVQYFQVGSTDQETFERIRARGGTRTVWVPTLTECETRGASRGEHGGSVQHSYGSSRGEHAYKRDLIEAPIVYEGLGRFSPANGFAANQILFFDGLASPVWSVRRGYWTVPGIAEYFDPNPYVSGQEPVYEAIQEQPPHDDEHDHAPRYAEREERADVEPRDREKPLERAEASRGSKWSWR